MSSGEPLALGTPSLGKDPIVGVKRNERAERKSVELPRIGGLKGKESESGLALLPSGRWCLLEAVGNDLALAGRVPTMQPVRQPVFCAAVSLCLFLWPGAVFPKWQLIFQVWP